MDFITEILLANYGAIFTMHLESQLRPIPAKRTPFPRLLGYGATRDVLRQAIRSGIWRSEPMERRNAQTHFLH